MLFFEGFLLTISIIMLASVAVYSFKKRNTRGAIELFYLMMGALIWTIGSLGEMLSNEFLSMLIFRNIQQIGVFSVPFFTIWFTIVYTRKEKYIKCLYPIAFIQLTSIVMIFTNELHGIMRKGYLIEKSEYFGNVLIVQSTITGQFLVSFNFIIPVFAIIILLGYRHKLAKKNRKETSLIIFSFSFTFFVTFLKEAFLRDIGIYISISTLYTPSAMIMFYCLYRYNFLNLSAISRDKIFEIINQGIIILNNKKKIIDLNEYAKDMLRKYGFSGKKLLGKNINDFKENSYIYKIINNIEKENKEISLSINGDKKYYSVSTYPLKEYEELEIGWVLLINNITTKKEYELRLKKFAEIDNLTQIYNRTTFQKKYEEIENRDENCSFLMIDFDYFKKINDTYGHATGDRILKLFSKLMKDYIKDKGIVGRLGGEEFGILLFGYKKEDAFEIAEDFRKMIEEAEFLAKEAKKIKCTISIGIADNEGEYKKFETIYNESDLALYKAKRKSRNCSVLFKR